MEPTVIQEIAEQLGIAVDNVGMFINEYLPQYAALKSVQMYSHIIGIAVGVALCLIVFLVMWPIGNRKLKLEVEDDYLHGAEYKVSTLKEESILYVILWILFGAGTVILLITLVILCIEDIPKIIGWNEYPQAMLIDMAVSKIS